MVQLFFIQISLKIIQAKKEVYYYFQIAILLNYTIAHLIKILDIMDLQFFTI